MRHRHDPTASPTPFALLIALLCASGALQAQTDSASTAQTVVVSATRHAMALVDAPAAITVVSAEQIAERGADNLLEALRGEPGLSLIGRTISGRRTLSLRGMDGRHTLFLVDGKRIGNSDGVIGHSDFQYDWVAVEDIARVEVLRGPMSSLYGAEALGGLVNTITRQPGARWSLRTLTEGALADGDLGGDGHRAALSLDGPINAQWRLGASASQGRRQAIISPLDAGISDIERRSKSDGALRLLWLPAAGHEVLAEHSEGQEQRWANMRERSGKRRYFESLTDLDRRHSSLGWTADWGGASALRSQLRTYSSHVGMANQRSQGVTALRPNVLDDEVIEGQLSAEAGPGRLFTAGFEQRREQLANGGLPGGSAQAQHRALYGQAEWALAPRLNLTTGLRYDHHEHFGSAWSPRIYLVWRPASDWVLKGGYGHGFKAPTLKQVAPGYQEDEGPFTYLSNTALKPETNHAWDLSLGWDSARFGAQATLFHNRVKQLVVPTLIGSVAGRAQYQFNNLERADISGLELSANANFAGGFSLAANATWLHAVDGTGQRLEKRPRLTLGLQAQWRQGPWSAGLRAEHLVDQLIAPTVLGQPPSVLPDVTRASAQLSRQFGPHWQATLAVDNLGALNLAQRSPLFSWAELPRTWRLSLRSRW